MGNQGCCKAQQQQLDLNIDPDDNIYSARFFYFYPEAQSTFKLLIFPKNYSKIQRKAITQFQQQGVFVGKQRCRMRSGLGIMIYEKQGYLYIGNWVNNNIQGLGYMLYKDGSYYQGQFYLNKPHGYGEYYNSTKKWVYKGKWKAGLKEGIGEQTFPDGAVFKGTYRNDLKQGQGLILFPNFCIYNDRQNNHLKSTTSSKTRCCFKGIFKNDIATGYGVQKGQNYKYEGEWKDNDMNGGGKTTYYNQFGEAIQFYIGEFKDGLKHGFGQYRWANGRIYKGQWQKGQISNKGVLIDQNNPNIFQK